MADEQSRGLFDHKQSWFVPWAELRELDNIDKPDFGYLRKIDSEFKTEDQFIKEGESFTISLESFVVQESHDRDNTNDLLVRSFVRYGDEPKTETIHFFGTDIEAGTFQGNLEAEHVFAKEAFSANSRIWLSFEIIEIDRGLNKDGNLVNALAKMRGRFGAIFPALNPFASLAGVAAGMVDKLRELQRAAARNEPIFQNEFDLYEAALGAGDGILRYGAYILFKKPVQGVQYQLGSGFELKRKTFTDRQNTPVSDDYIVVKITPGIVKSGQASKELLKNQQVATVVSELDKSETDDERTQRHFDFLEDIVVSAKQFKDIDKDAKEYRELISQQNAVKMIGETFPQDKKDRLIEIATRLGQLLPLNN